MFKRLRKANVFKPNKFHYALVEYLHDELTNNNIKNKKRISYIKIDLPRKIEDRFNKIIIDCFNGKVYLRDEENKDRQLLRLNRFYGNRESDAMDCAESVCRQIKHYLSKLEDKEITANNNIKRNYIDIRTTKNKIIKNNLIDMRKRIVAKQDIKNRDFAIAIINGEVFDGDTHGEAITKYLKTIGIDNISVFDRDELEYTLGKGITNQFAAAHAVGDKIYIEPDTLENITLDEAVNLLKYKYPNYKIINIISDERLAITNNKYIKISRLKKKANNNIYIVNGKVYENVENIAKDNTIYQIARAKKIGNKIYLNPIGYHVNKLDFISLGSILADNYPDYEIYLQGKNEKLALKKWAKHDMDNRDSAILYINGKFYENTTHAMCINTYLRENDKGKLWSEQIRPSFNYLTTDERIGTNIDQLAFAHKKDNNIYLETKTLENISIDNIVTKLKQQYPNYVIYSDDNYINDEYEKLAKYLNNIKTSLKHNNLKKQAWHDGSNRDAALVYIDGEIYEGETHASCINQYLTDHYKLNLNDTQIRPNINIEVDDAWDDSQAEDLQNIYDNIKKMAFGHIIKNNKEIYIEPEGYNISQTDLTTICQDIKSKYTDYSIYIDGADGVELQKVASQIGYHDKTNRDSAILIIDGDVMEGYEHYEMINDYLLNNYDIDRSNFETEEEGDRLFDSLSYALGSKVDSEKTIYIDDICINNMNENEIINILRQTYPDYKAVFEEDNDDAITTYNETLVEKYNETYLKGGKRMHRLRKIADITKSETLNINDIKTWVIHHYNFELEKNPEAYKAFKNDDQSIGIINEFDDLAEDLINKLQTTDDSEAAEIMFDFKTKLYDWFPKYQKCAA